MKHAGIFFAGLAAFLTSAVSTEAMTVIPLTSEYWVGVNANLEEVADGLAVTAIYRDRNSIQSKQFYDIRDSVSYFKWKAICELTHFSGWEVSFLLLGNPAFLLRSNPIFACNEWYFTRVVVSGSTGCIGYTATGDYDDDGGTLVQERPVIFSDSPNGEPSATKFLITVLDDYLAGDKIVLGEAKFNSGTPGIQAGIQAVWNIELPSVEPDPSVTGTSFVMAADHGPGDAESPPGDIDLRMEVFAECPNGATASAGLVGLDTSAAPSTVLFSSSSSGDVYTTTWSFDWTPAIADNSAIYSSGASDSSASASFCIRASLWGEKEDEENVGEVVDVLVNFHQVELTINFVLEDGSWGVNDYSTRAVNPEETSAQETVTAVARRCNIDDDETPAVYDMNDLVCIEVCPSADSDDYDDYATTQLRDLFVRDDGGTLSLSQRLTSSTGEAVGTGLVNDVDCTTADKCCQVTFVIEGAFFPFGGENSVTAAVDGNAVFEIRGNARHLLRGLISTKKPREELTLDAVSSDFELELELAGTPAPEDSSAHGGSICFSLGMMIASAAVITLSI